METKNNKFICYDNREYSWLKFNERVLEEACIRSGNPLIERLKFLSIFTTNLDEFYMVRVGILSNYVKFFKKYIDNKTNLTAQEQLDGIFRITKKLYAKRDTVYDQTVFELEEKGIVIKQVKELSQDEKKKLKKYYKKNIFPLLSPQVIDVWHPFPFLQNKKLYVGVEISGKKDSKFIGIIPVPNLINRLVPLEDAENTYVLLENVIESFADEIFTMYKVQDATVLCVTRNADIEVEYELNDDDSLDYRQYMKKLMKGRSKLAPVRLEFQKKMSKFFVMYFLKHLDISEKQLFHSKAPINMSFAFALEDMVSAELKEKLVFTPFKPKEDIELVRDKKLADRIFKQDLFFHYPYDSMRPFLNLMKQAALDERVQSIKITLYRIAKDSQLANSLIEAAENGKEVTILMELRARFDEENNIEWAQRFEEAGCKVIYGADRYKVHSKICMITYQEKGSIRYITHVGTGNYNEKTSRIYTDFNIITADETIGADADNFFKNMAVNNFKGEYAKLWIAPFGFKQNIIAHIENEIAKADRGEPAKISIKCNSFTDLEIIDALIKASQHNVPVTLIVRGICCLVPKVPDFTANIKVISIVGRFLEHSRMYSFGVGEEQIMYISSGDMMTRNTENRIEICCPVENRGIKEKINRIIEIILKDTVKARELKAKKRYHRVLPKKNEAPVNSQEVFMK